MAARRARDRTNLIPQTALLNDVHANVQHVFHQLLALPGCGGGGGRFSLLPFLVARTENGFSENLEVASLDSDADHLVISANLVTALKQPADDTLQALLDISLEG